MNPHYSNIVSHLAGKTTVTISTGATCAYLGDERNLREFVVADEVARQVRKNGQTAVTLLIDDSLDPLNYRQLRVGVKKDPVLIEKCQSWCGKPISHLPDPYGCCESYADHFEKELLNRLHYVDCHPTLIRTGKLYERGVYQPYIEMALGRSDEIRQFLKENFPDYQPEKLFWPICHTCGYIDCTVIEKVELPTVQYHCSRCSKSQSVGIADLKGKLNWKLDCAVRWSICKVDAEAFSTAYLELQNGSYHIAQALNKAFFGAREVLPIYYGFLKMDKNFGLQVLDSLPRATFRQMLTDKPATDINLTQEMIVNIASRYEVMPELTYLNFVKQLLPIWLLTPDKLDWNQRELVTHGIAFTKNFLNREVKLHLPKREHFEGESAENLSAIYDLFQQTIALRQTDPTSEEFAQNMGTLTAQFEKRKSAIFKRLRKIVGQERGMSVVSILYILPVDYLQMLTYVLEMMLEKKPLAVNEELIAA